MSKRRVKYDYGDAVKIEIEEIPEKMFIVKMKNADSHCPVCQKKRDIIIRLANDSYSIQLKYDIEGFLCSPPMPRRKARSFMEMCQAILLNADNAWMEEVV